jgi:translation initiation factor 2B subunit (eIF-2B alpha/beta/delta family)
MQIHRHIIIYNHFHAIIIIIIIISLRYDLTPISNISVVATETGLIPPTSRPVLIRELKDTR